ncbi:hypothetical protein FRC12_013003 [Ceratobasidium sp. 428]|nr:hypothetical protein FRC12_013003 [Ceratobasidium sp. 428]
MQAEQCSSQLQNANFACRTCGAGGTTQFKQSESGYVTLFKTGDKRSPAQTRERVDALLAMSIQPGQKTHIKELARDWGIKDTLGQLCIDRMLDTGEKMREAASNQRTACNVTLRLQPELDTISQNGCFNTFLDMDFFGFDAHKDTPTEILHTVLLSVVKYFWGQTAFILAKSHQMCTLEARLDALDISGLSIDSTSARYMCHYTGSLVGKHFKILAQLMPFACFDLIEANLMEVWLLLGRLAVLLWFTMIENIDTYLVIIGQFLLAAARCSPSIIVQKPEFHLLLHLPMLIRRFGPAILFSTERFESFHGVFRAASLFSNHRAPSRDIAEYFVGLDRLKHVCSGGYWKAGSSWVRASSLVHDFILDHNEFSRLLELPLNAQKAAGSVALLPRRNTVNRTPTPWHIFCHNYHLPLSIQPGSEVDAYFGVISVTSETSDVVEVESNASLSSKKFAQVKALLGCVSPDGAPTYYAYTREYQVLTRDLILGIY